MQCNIHKHTAVAVHEVVLTLCRVVLASVDDTKLVLEVTKEESEGNVAERAFGKMAPVNWRGVTMGAAAVTRPDSDDAASIFEWVGELAHGIAAAASGNWHI